MTILEELSYTLTVIDDSQPDPYDVDGQFAALCCCSMPTANGDTFCVLCRAKHEQLLRRARMANLDAAIELIPLVSSYAAHVRAACAGAPCLSCGDMTICGDYCAACVETGENTPVNQKAGNREESARIFLLSPALLPA